MSKKRADLSGLAQEYPGKRAFITGAGSGLGLALALELARKAWTVGLTDIDEERLQKSAALICSSGGEPVPYLFDVSDFEKFRDCVDDFDRRHSGIDIAINNAGVGCGGYLHELPVEIFRRVIEVNLMGVVHGCHVFIPIMKRQGSGHILNVASAAAFVGAPRMSAYNSSKSAVLALSETLRAELSEEKILVSVLLPTYLQSNIGKDALGASEDVRFAKLFVEQSKLTAEQVALETLVRMERGEFYIVLPEEARFLWRFKRLLPDRFCRFISKEAKRRVSQIVRDAGSS